jgi:NADH-ubiquinone oxidoreductase chain 3
MTSTTFFIVFIPFLAILLLFINLLLAPHNPYQEKDSAFECGFHSFLGQNRIEFSISFFIFALLFLLFDLEILLVYPYSVSGYTNDIYGLVIMMIFFVLLTLGFIFELGKNALTIDSKQIFVLENKIIYNVDSFTNLQSHLFPLPVIGHFTTIYYTIFGKLIVNLPRIIHYLNILYYCWVCLFILVNCFCLIEINMDNLLIYISLDMNFTGEFLHMDGNNYNYYHNNIEPSTGGNNNGGTPGGGPDNTNVAGYTTADESERGVRRSNPMSLTQMCNATDLESYVKEPLPTTPELPDKETLKKIHDVLSDQKEQYLDENKSLRTTHRVAL